MDESVASWIVNAVRDAPRPFRVDELVDLVRRTFHVGQRRALRHVRDATSHPRGQPPEVAIRHGFVITFRQVREPEFVDALRMLQGGGGGMP